MSAAREIDGSKFPAGIVIVLSLCMTLNTYSVGSLFSYVGVMVKELLDLESTNESGYYAGYLGSAYMLGRFVGGYPLGRVADFVGRKPIIISGLLSIAVFSLTFGLASTFGSAIASRFLLGLTNGIVPALRTTLREVCGPAHSLQGMNYLGGCKAFSLVLGTGIGGFLAQPAVNYPDVFPGTGLFGRYPFLLPNVVGSLFALVLLPLVVVYIPETKGLEEQAARKEVSSADNGGGAKSERSLTEKKPLDNPDTASSVGISNGNGGRGSLACQDQTAGDYSWEKPDKQSSAGARACLEVEGADTTYDKEVNAPYDGGGCGWGGGGGRDDDDGYPDIMVENEEPGVWGPDGLLAVPHVKMVLFLAFLVQAIHIGFEEAYPLWALSTPDAGGLGWDTIDIGKVFLVAGLIVAALLFAVFPCAIKALGVTTWQKVGCLVGVPAFVAIPNARLISLDDGGLFAVSAGCIALIYCCQAMVMLAFVVASTSLVESGMRGKLAGLYNAVESFGCFLGPICFANVFAWSISPSAPDWVDHHFVFYAAAFGMVVVAVLARGTISDTRMMEASSADGDKRAGSDVDVPGAACNGRKKQGAAGTPVPDVFRSDASGEADLV